ncbi:MAG: hypothetical protein IPL06_22955 [Betaproteobacteria bacterium]|nr:hypothetical protein [Betaproteobacteria bacterium]
MNADVTPMAADDSLEGREIRTVRDWLLRGLASLGPTVASFHQTLSAAIGVTSAFIGVQRLLHPWTPIPR